MCARSGEIQNWLGEKCDFHQFNDLKKYIGRYQRLTDVLSFSRRVFTSIIFESRPLGRAVAAARHFRRRFAVVPGHPVSVIRRYAVRNPFSGPRAELTAGADGRRGHCVSTGATRARAPSHRGQLLRARAQYYVRCLRCPFERRLKRARARAEHRDPGRRRRRRTTNPLTVFAVYRTERGAKGRGGPVGPSAVAAPVHRRRSWQVWQRGSFSPGVGPTNDNNNIILEALYNTRFSPFECVVTSRGLDGGWWG